MLVRKLQAVMLTASERTYVLTVTPISLPESDTLS